MKNKKIIFVEPAKVELWEEDLQEKKLEQDEVLVEKIYSLISPGTELAVLSGSESWFSFPGSPGYASVSRIVKLGDGTTDFAVGDIVFHYGDHSKYQMTTTKGVFLKVPENLDLKWVPFTRMATVAMTSLRISNIELGDYVTVTGLGLIGNMASQLASLQGAQVIGLDLAEERLRIARDSGIAFTLNSRMENIKEEIENITEGFGISSHIEATGIPSVAVESLKWISSFGELILLGSPRGEYQTNVTDVLNYCHLITKGCITFKGAHEWRYSIERNPYTKHSLVRNSQVVFQLMKENKLKIEPLLSHVLKPEQAEEAYMGLKDKKDEYTGVIFDWN